MRFPILCVVAMALIAPAGRAQTGSTAIPVFKTSVGESRVNFFVKASVALTGKFAKWSSTFKVTSTDAKTGVLDIKIDAASVSTGSGMKDGKLKSDDFFDVEHNPYITFHSTKIVRTGPTTFDVDGDFTIRGVSKPEVLKLDIGGIGTGVATVKGKMTFDRKDYGMTKGIPFVKIADHVEVSVDLVVKRVSGPALVLDKAP